MKMRRHRIVLVLCMAGLCLISFMHFLKALSYITFSRELSSFTPSLRSIFVDSQFLWKESASERERAAEAEPAAAPTQSPSLSLDLEPGGDSEEEGEEGEGEEGGGPGGEAYRRKFHLRDERVEYFVHTKAGAVCFKHGTKREARSTAGSVEEGRRGGGPANRQPTRRAQPRPGGRRRRWVGCVCRPGWHGPSCGVPTLVQFSNLPTKDRLSPRSAPRRLINAININHEFDLLDVRFHELGDVVDVFVVCESNFTAYGDPKPLRFLEMLSNGSYDHIKHKVLYVFLDHFPSGGRQDGWIADDYLRTYLTRDGLRRVAGVRADDVFVINDADEIPARDGLLFLKLFDGWTEPFGFHLRKSLYGFFWKQPGTLEVVAGCTVGMLRSVYEGDGIKLRRREYYLMPGFRQYENATGHILVQWSLGSALHFAGWHCSWCFTPEGIRHKLVSAQNGDFPRWGNYQEKRELGYIRELIQTGGWFDGTLQDYPPADPKEQMYAPKFLLRNFDKYRYILENPYRREGAKPRDPVASNGSAFSASQLPPPHVGMV